jgi:DNA-binding transcriptional ArsR family regulator
MARAPTTFDPFNAVAEPKRRQVMDLLMHGERPVNDIVVRLGWSQPQVSKHLGVLRQVGLVNVRREGRQQFYTLNAAPLKPIHEWVRSYERFWAHHLHRIKDAAEARAKGLAAAQRETLKKRSDTDG